jgi:hypothetical protein
LAGRIYPGVCSQQEPTQGIEKEYEYLQTVNAGITLAE